MQKKNFYSLTPLIATIDQDEELTNLDLILAEDLEAKEIKQYLKQYQRIVIALSFRTAQLQDIYEKMKLFYSLLNSSDLERILFIAGGSHPSGDAITTLRMGFDFSFIGESEYSLPFFLKRFLQNDDICTTPGIGYLEDASDELILTRKPNPINLDDYPFISKKRRLYPPLEISRGCVFGCTFCQVPNLFLHQTRHRSTEVIINAAKWMVHRKLNDIRFITPNSFGYMSSKPREVNKEAIIYLLKTLKSLDGVRDIYFGTFPGEVRPETVSEELMSDIKLYIANQRISIGLQSGSDEVLEKICRGHTVEESVNAINVIIKTGFTPVVDIIIGLPGATEADEFKTLELIDDLVQKGSVIRAHVFMPLPGTALEKTEYKPVYAKVRKALGNLSSKGKIEGSWSQQEKYALDSWKTIQRISNLDRIKK